MAFHESRSLRSNVRYYFFATSQWYNNIMSEKDIARQVLRGYIDREIDLENQLKEILNRRKTVVVEEGDFFKIRREQMEKQKKIAKKRNETFLKDLEHTTAKLRASLACDDLTDKKLDNERKKFTDYVRQTRRGQSV
ncbi:uncharacterized protein LOC100166538 [Acyrthosiphon pisum]|uniref:Uncharacterized protein n=1 Tax=Acyrthosiphon pisum TaxID=7029 RepID=A0A8R1W6R7_ACYPI|nr:uncharacterized protein LOC100166538 [Acyrthosiphon pisum]XP_029344317.1 uncharacterized protein LOC100166538 [Acyrthosiphon pisum]|eukprot:XP_003247123.1 PREDICTED: uncharacterized protein LOC100166538 [Acyrthosiphon pisum]